MAKKQIKFSNTTKGFVFAGVSLTCAIILYNTAIYPLMKQKKFRDIENELRETRLLPPLETKNSEFSDR